MEFRNITTLTMCVIAGVGATGTFAGAAAGITFGIFCILYFNALGIATKDWN